jgi:hypothetical protein
MVTSRTFTGAKAYRTDFISKNEAWISTLGTCFGHTLRCPKYLKRMGLIIVIAVLAFFWLEEYNLMVGFKVVFSVEVHRRFGWAYISHLHFHVSCFPVISCLAYFSALKMEALSSPETSVASTGLQDITSQKTVLFTATAIWSYLVFFLS